MFNAKLRKNAIDNYNAAVERYEKVANDLGENTNVLYKEREKALKLVKLIEERINQLANTPKEFKVTLQKIEIEMENFKTKQKEIKKECTIRYTPQNYLANSTFLTSRTTVTLIWPGYSRFSSISPLTSRAKIAA